MDTEIQDAVLSALAEEAADKIERYLIERDFVPPPDGLYASLATYESAWGNLIVISGGGVVDNSEEGVAVAFVEPETCPACGQEIAPGKVAIHLFD